jgi:hypothetical protein
MTVAENLRKICAAARPAIEAALDAAEELSEIREAASEQGLDWSQVKALLKAQIQDERDGGERVKKLVAKADNAATYAAMLSNNVAQKQESPTQPKPATDAASSHSAAAPTQVSLASGGGNLGGCNAALSDEAAPPGGVGVGIGGAAMTATSGHLDTDPSLDIRNQPFYRGGQEWPR